MKLNQKQTVLLYTLISILAFTPLLNPTIALLLGIVLSLFNIRLPQFTKHTNTILQASIVLMGFGMNLEQVLNASKSGFLYTTISVTLVMLTGLLLTRLLKIDGKIGVLISAGTAICGGSAIAAIAQSINAKHNQITFSLVVVFILNAIALIIFPAIGHHFNMSEEVFGKWAAIAIHDTSSVVGAGAIYGPKALITATTVKLIRALWIIPLSIVIALFGKDKSGKKIKIPWFIFLFVVAIIISYAFPQADETYGHLSWLGKRSMVIALFLIGSSITIQDVKKTGFKSFALGITLWIITAVTSFLAFTI